MSLKYAMLGFLHYKPFTGYELKATFDTSVWHFWPADQAQIYRTLAELAEEGWATMEVVPQEDRPSKKVYHITEAGREALRGWLAAPLPPQDHRSAELIQVFFAGQLTDGETLAMFERFAQQYRAMLATYSQIPEQIKMQEGTIGSSREAFFWLLTLEHGIHAARSGLDWVDSVIERIKNKQVPQE